MRLRVTRQRFLALTGLIIACLACAIPSHADSLQDLSGTLTSAGDVAAWGDYDGDGLQDLTISSPTGTRIYRASAGSFTDSGVTSLPSARFLAWGDIDNDGDMDLFIIGSNMHPDTDIFRNDGGGVFTRLQVVRGEYMVSSGQWADYDNDGDVDLMTIESLWGSSNQVSVGVYVNDGGVFRHGTPLLTAGRIDGLSWGDYDADGDWDFAVIGGASQYSMFGRVYRNDGSTFTNTGASLVTPWSVGLAWGDYDSDGDLDLAVIGSSGFGGASNLYRNDAGTFVNSGAALPSWIARATWGDCDNDGDLDLLIAGTDDSSLRRVGIYLNNAGTFTDSGLSTTAISGGSIAFSDYDRDGRMEFLLSGYSNAGLKAFRLYRYTANAVNTAPTAPANLSATQVADTVVFTWDAASDSQTTDARGLSYNLRIGTSPGAGNLYSSMSNLTSGVRYVPRSGSASKSVTRFKLPAGTLYWSVQAADGAYAGGPWAEERTITVIMKKITGYVRDGRGLAVPGVSLITGGMGPSASTNSNGYYELWVPSDWSGTVTPSKTLSYIKPSSRSYANVTADLGGQDYQLGSFEWTFPAGVYTGFEARAAWGDYDSDGDLDLLQCCRSGTSTPVTYLFRNNGDGTFAAVTSGMTGMYDGAIAWGDYDNDGDLDVVVGGNSNTYSDPVPTLKLYRNDSGSFADSGVVLPGMMRGDLAWGDYDNDGDLDLTVSGTVGDDLGTKVFRNSGGAFVDSGMVIPGGSGAKLAWVDYDRDGDLDLHLLGRYGSSTLFTLYRNDSGTLSDSGISFGTVYSAYAISWGDYDGDGYMDLAAADSGRISVRRNVGNGTFSQAYELYFSGSDIVWLDYDNDGDLDLAATGYESGSYVTKLIRNDAGAFVPSGLQSYGAQNCGLAAGDYDRDGDLDILVAGNGCMKNHAASANTAPTAPTTLACSQSAGVITLSWTAGSDAETQSGALYYNLRIGTTPGSNDIFSGMSTSAGVRCLPAFGNCQRTAVWKIKGLANGTTYYWSVQAVDAGFVGSPWATERSFVRDTVPPTINLLSLSPTRVAAGDTVHIYADVTDNIGVTSVGMGELGLEHGGWNSWFIDIAAASEPGEHEVTIRARDAAGNTSTATASYMVLRVLGVCGRDLSYELTQKAADQHLYRFWGKLVKPYEEGFILEDGSGVCITVISPEYKEVEEGIFLSVTGSLDTSAERPTLLCAPECIVRLQAQ